MKKFVFFWLLLFVVLAGLYYLALRGRVSAPVDGLGALGGGAALTLVIAAFLVAGSARKDRALLDRALAETPYEDGERIAVIGPLLALGSPVHAPLSGEPCILCAWNISHEAPIREGGKATEWVEDFSGFIMAPCVVQDPRGNVRLLDLPAIEGFPGEDRNSHGDFLRARDYLQSAPFEKLSIAKLISGKIVADDAGVFRQDWQKAGDDFRLVHGVHALTEHVVREDETVCAIGIYSAERQGLFPGKIRENERVKLIQGDSTAAREALTKTFWKYSVGGVLLFIIAHAVLLDFAVRNAM